MAKTTLYYISFLIYFLQSSINLMDLRLFPVYLKTRDEACSIFMLPILENRTFLDLKYPVLKLWCFGPSNKTQEYNTHWMSMYNTSNVKKILIHDKNTFASFGFIYYVLCYICQFIIYRYSMRVQHYTTFAVDLLISNSNRIYNISYE